MQLHIISFPEFFVGESRAVSNLLIACDCVFHLRKPNAKSTEFRRFLEEIPFALHHKIILHDAYELGKIFPVKGLHFSSSKRDLTRKYSWCTYKSTSCHSLDEVKTVTSEFTACFLSPIFPSISKKGYSGNLNLNEIKSYLDQKPPIDIIGLGGICTNNIAEIQQLGFRGAAVLGCVWGENPNADKNYLNIVNELKSQIEQPYCLSIAGFDPSSGAGITADIKTFEAHNCYGLGVITALTYQNDEEFTGVKWFSTAEIENQLNPLAKYPVKVVKIGLVESFSSLKEIVQLVKKQYPKAYIIWDSILKASAGFHFHENEKINAWFLEHINLITPNEMEFNQLNINIQELKNSILLKGGHSKLHQGIDILYTKKDVFTIEGQAFKDKKDKHGTGCVLSSAIAANMALGNELYDACRLAKKYIEKFIQSNPNKLGYHDYH